MKTVGREKRAAENGVILIALLWILTALSLIALSFARESYVEVAAARNAQSLENSYFVARAGIDAAVYRILQKQFNPSPQLPSQQDTPDPLDRGIVTGALGGGAYRVDIQDESGKINVNQVMEEQLHLLMEAAGIPKEDGDVITDSILDWRDNDRDHRANGAENDYYETLNPPYTAKNGKIETIEELLLIRGITPEYFYGRPERDAEGAVVYKYGLSRYLTTYSGRIQVNVNFAPLAVLMSVPGMTPDIARKIYERRQVKPFKTQPEIAQDMGIPSTHPAMINLTALPIGQPGMVYTLTASANAANSKVRRVIRTVVSIEMAARKPYRILYWNENVPDYEGMTP